ncbi:hypothetical protein Tco_0790493 [Tanacetum coccineum]
MSMWIISRGVVLLILLMEYKVLIDFLLHRSSTNNSARLSNKFGGFYFSFTEYEVGKLAREFKGGSLLALKCLVWFMKYYANVRRTVADFSHAPLNEYSPSPDDKKQWSLGCWFGGKLIQKLRQKGVYEESFSRHAAWIGGKLIQFMHTTMVPVQVKTMKIQAGIQEHYEIDEVESDKAKFSNMYDMILQECVSNDIMCSYLQSSSDLDEITELQCLYLHKVKEYDCLAQKLSEYQQNLTTENDTVCKEKASNVFQKEREQYFEIQDLKAQLQDKNIAINLNETKRAETSVANDTSGLVPQRQKASDYDNPDPAPELQNVSPSADTTISRITDGQRSLDKLKVHGNPSKPVQTRRQLATDPEMCMFALTEELHQFDRLQVWELVDKLVGKNVIKLKYQARPTEKHLKEVKRIFRYLRGTINMGLWYPKGSGFDLTAFSDADHAGCVDTRKSTSGGIQFLGDKLVSWMSKKQDCTAMSSAKADVALSASSIENSATPCTPPVPSTSKLALSEDRFQYLVRRIGMRCLTPAELEVLTNESA